MLELYIKYILFFGYVKADLPLRTHTQSQKVSRSIFPVPHRPTSLCHIMTCETHDIEESV